MLNNLAFLTIGEKVFHHGKSNSWVSLHPLHVQCVLKYFEQAKNFLYALTCMLRKFPKNNFIKLHEPFL